MCATMPALSRALHLRLPATSARTWCATTRAFVGEIRDSDDGIGGETESPTVGMTAHLDALPQQRETSQSDTEYLRKRLLEAFAKLPPILRDAYTMFQVGEMSVRDIANQTGVSENLVKVRIFRAKEKLKVILADLHVTF